jgi:hypothetical protein
VVTKKMELIGWINQQNLWFKEHDENSFFENGVNL